MERIEHFWIKFWIWWWIMLRHLGYVEGPDARTVRIKFRADLPSEPPPDAIRQTIRRNLEELANRLRTEVEQGIFIHRVPSDVIPSASHPEKILAWWDEFAADLVEIGESVRGSGMRLEMHPGPLCLLTSPSPETIALSILELGWHVRFLDALQLDSTHKLAVRIGPAFGDRAGSIERFICVVNALPLAWKARLSIENCQNHDGLLDVIDLSKRTDLPVLLAADGHKRNYREQREAAILLERCFETWRDKDGVPILHLGCRDVDGDPRTRPGIEATSEDLGAFLNLAPADRNFDCLLQTSKNGLAVYESLKSKMCGESPRLPERINTWL